MPKKRSKKQPVKGRPSVLKVYSIPKKPLTEAEVLKKMYPRNTKLQNMLKKDKNTSYARFSMDSVDPDDIIAEGEYTFVREIWLSGGKNSKFKTVYESKMYVDPTYRDAWKEFKKGQKAVYDKIGPFDHVFLEDVFPAKGKKRKLTFGTGS